LISIHVNSSIEPNSTKFILLPLNLTFGIEHQMSQVIVEQQPAAALVEKARLTKLARLEAAQFWAGFSKNLPSSSSTTSSSSSTTSSSSSLSSTTTDIWNDWTAVSPAPAPAPAPAPTIVIGFTGGRGRRRGGLSTRSIRHPNVRTCAICQEKKLGFGRSSDFYPSTPCAPFGSSGPTEEQGHTDFCRECLGKMVELEVQNAFTKVGIRCPFVGCKGFIQDHTILNILRTGINDDRVLYRKYIKLQGMAHGNRLKDYFAHSVKLSPEDQLTVQWIKDNARYCPRCQVLIDKNDGCKNLLSFLFSLFQCVKINNINNIIHGI